MIVFTIYPNVINTAAKLAANENDARVWCEVRTLMNILLLLAIGYRLRLYQVADNVGYSPKTPSRGVAVRLASCERN